MGDQVCCCLPACGISHVLWSHNTLCTNNSNSSNINNNSNNNNNDNNNNNNLQAFQLIGFARYLLGLSCGHTRLSAVLPNKSTNTYRMQQDTEGSGPQLDISKAPECCVHICCTSWQAARLLSASICLCRKKHQTSESEIQWQDELCLECRCTLTSGRAMLQHSDDRGISRYIAQQ